ncbi:MAG: SdrD B-like domain-containing protein [Chloroflexota bacterium]
MWNRISHLSIGYRGRILLIISLLLLFHCEPAIGIVGQIVESRGFTSSARRVGLGPSIAQAQATGPGGIDTDLNLWLKGDDGTASGALWSDQTNNGNDATQATVSRQPTFSDAAINYNPGINFDGSNDYLQFATDLGLIGAVDHSVFAVTAPDALDTRMILGYRNTGSHKWMLSFSSGNGSKGLGGGGTPTCAGTTARTVVAGEANFVSYVRESTSTGTISLNGGGESSFPCANNSSADTMVLGARITSLNGGRHFFDGPISEVVIYSTALDQASIHRVESYLALKYGITLTGTQSISYTNSVDTIVWDATANVAFHNNVAGLGQDDRSGLNQRISGSTSADGVVVISHDNDFTLPNTDSSRTSLGDGNFLLWGNNGLDATFWISDTAASGVPAGKDRLAREWMVQETGSVGAVSLQINVDNPDMDLPEVLGLLYLLVDSDMDGDFGDESAQKMTAQGGGLYTISDINFISGQRFTFATPNSGIRGFVFLDNDVDGQRDANEAGLENITVTAVDANGVMTSTVTDADGKYIFLPESGIEGSTRITFSLPSVGGATVMAAALMATGDDETLDPTVFGRDNQTSVNFAHVGSGWTVVNAGFTSKERPSTCAAPTVATSCYSSGPGTVDAGLFSFDYSNGPTANTTDAGSDEMGATWANTHSANDGRLYSAAVLKRHVGLGPLANFNGTDTYTVDGVYVTAYSAAGGNFNAGSPGFTLQGVTPANGGSSIDLGTVQRTVDSNGTLDDDYEIRAGRSVDLDAFAKVGTVGFGGADIAPDGALWLVNLNQRQLIRVDTAGLPTDGSAAPSGNVTAYPISDPGCANGDYRPWALNFYGGNGYLGIVCSAETSQNQADLHVHIVSFDLAAPGTYTPEIDFPLNYARETLFTAQFGGNGPRANWLPWTSTWQTVGRAMGWYAYPQPILSDIVFNIDGDMMLGFMDRFGHQTISRNLSAQPLSQRPRTRTILTAGDMGKVCADGAGGWILEGDSPDCSVLDRGGIRIQPVGGINFSAEFFYRDEAGVCIGHVFMRETYGGGLCLGPNGTDVLASVYAPGGEGSGLGGIFGGTTSTLLKQGFRTFTTDQGGMVRGTAMPLPNSLACSAGTSHNMGQLACFCPPPPVEIGNRVWIDYDLDGEQDPDEPPISGVTVELVSGGSVIATAITDARGEYYFSGFSGTDKANAKYNLAIPGSGVSVRIPNADGTQQTPLVGLVLTPVDQGSDDRIDSDATLNGNDAVIPAITAPGTIDHTFDFGFAPDDWDLALRKSVPVQYVAPGSNVVFTIDIFNQGAGPIDNIEIVDYVPANLSVNDASWAPNALTGPGTVTRTLTAGNELPSRGLWPGESVSVDISMAVAGGLTDNTVIINKAEIANMTSLSGSPIVDIDSTPDTTDGEANVKDDIISEDGLNNPGDDEDDHDPAQITVTSQTDIYDLALRKRLAIGQSDVVNEGDDVLFTIELFNQGTSAASAITLVDRYPTGFSLSPNDTNWTDQGATATVDWSGTLQPGQSATVDIILRAGTTLGTVQNYAEIESDDGDDVDSEPEDEESDTNGDTLLDDVISDDGTIDEDDHDVAEVTVRRFDLALRKQLVAGQPTTTVKGADVTYIIDVFNQGSVDAFDISVVDYLTDTLAVSENDANGWVLVDTNQVVKNIPGPLAPNTGERLTITLRISDTAALGPLDNYAEIVTASDLPAGPPAQDMDSAPDTINGNDPLVDDEILNDGTTDQDDHDIASVTIARFDLALIKEYVSDTSRDGNSTDGIIGIGDQVVFRMTVTNQGDVPAYDIRVTDHNPEGIVADDSDPSLNIDNGWSTENMILNHNVLPGPLNPGASTMVEITLRSVGPNSILYPAAGLIGTHTNWAEISSAANLPGGPSVVDEDSVYDEDETNDAGGQPGSLADDATGGDGSGSVPGTDAATDEDDHDPAQITVQNTFDLAVIKYLIHEDGAPNFDVPEVAAGDVITYEYYLENQGTETATSVTLVEHVPDGLILIDNNWTPSPVTGPGTATRTYTVTLAPGEHISDTVLFQTVPDIQPGQIYTNIIEIESATNAANLDDIDSDPDNNPTNEIFVEDNQLRDNFRLNPQMLDEDDHDPAAVMTAATAEITLTKQLNTPPTVTVGSAISFTIRITNTGSVTITSLPLTDTFDAAYLSFNAVDDALGPNPSTNINANSVYWADATAYDTDNDGQLGPNEVLELIVVFDTIAETTNAAGGGVDCNEAAGSTYNKAMAMGIDACVEVSIDPIEPKLTLGDIIWHDIDNDGQQDANELGIDGVLVYLWELDGSNNPIITSLVTATTTTTNTGGGSVSGFYQFEVPSGKSYQVEVAASNFVSGSQLEGFVLGANQGNITDDGDPHQQANNVTVNVDTLDFGFYCEFDLALVKTLAVGQPATIAPGDDVTFTLTIHNQGTVTATNISIADYIPADFTLNGGNWSGTGTGPATVTQVLPGPLTPSGTASDSTTINIVLTAGATLSGTYTNTAEIITYTTSIVDSNGNVLPDVDSIPDTIDGNGAGETTNLVDDDVTQDGKNGGDEDDHDPAAVTVTATPANPSIAVDKQFNGMGDYRVGETISFTIRITNTGDVVVTSLPLEDRYSHAFITYVSANPAPNSEVDGILTWTDVLSSVNDIDGLGLGESVNVVVTFTTEADTTLLPAPAPCTRAGHAPNLARSVGAMAGFDLVAEDGDDTSCDSVQILNPTAVQLAERSISQTPEGVMVRWSTVSETDIVGFNIWKSSGVAVELRSGGLLVASNAGQSNGASYQWLDEGATLSQGDAYVLEILRNNGTSERTVIDVMRDEQIFLPLVSR